LLSIFGAKLKAEDIRPGIHVLKKDYITILRFLVALQD
jgi:hypothetical protein